MIRMIVMNQKSFFLNAKAIFKLKCDYDDDVDDDDNVDDEWHAGSIIFTFIFLTIYS